MMSNLAPSVLHVSAKLSQAEKDEVVTSCDHLAKLKYSKTLPYAFTEHGALMVATVLNT